MRLLVCMMLAFSAALAEAQVKWQGKIPPKYEFRAAWIATVSNIDFPSRKGLPADSQRLEFQAILGGSSRVDLQASMRWWCKFVLPPMHSIPVRTNLGQSG
jgi:hypothetical protein